MTAIPILGSTTALLSLEWQMHKSMNDGVARKQQR
jgi:hypothetical protein